MEMSRVTVYRRSKLINHFENKWTHWLQIERANTAKFYLYAHSARHQLQIILHFIYTC